MKIAILSESPSLPTGFGKTTRTLAQALHELNFEVICFGIGVWGKLIDQEKYDYSVWPVGEANDNLENKFLRFVSHVKPDVLLINYDLITAAAWIKFLRRVNYNVKICLHLVIDGLPVFPSILKILNECSSIIVPLECVKQSLHETVQVPIYVFPHLIDDNEFFEDLHIKNLKNEMSKFFVGIFAQNRSRKQICQGLQAIALAAKEIENLYLVLHTDFLNATWRDGDNLKALVEYYNLQDRCYLKETHNQFDITKDKKVHLTDLSDNFDGHINNASIEQKINFCDVVLVPTTHGGFEFSIIESQACGVPVCSTNDGSILYEVAGNSTYLLEPSLYDFTTYGAKINRLSPNTISSAIIDVFSNPEVKSGLTLKGKVNAEKYYLKSKYGELKKLLSLIIIKT